MEIQRGHYLGVLGPDDNPTAHLREADDVFDRYLSDFTLLAEGLEELRAPWKEKAQWNDPMHFDEAEFRILDCKLMNHLVLQGAKPSEIKAFHVVRCSFV